MPTGSPPVDRPRDCTGARTGLEPVGRHSVATPTPDIRPAVDASTPTSKTAAITKDANGDELAGVDDEVTFTFHLENTGNVTLEDVGVDDETLADLGVPVSCPTTTLAPGAEMDCVSGVYLVTQADIEAGRVRNVATAEATTPPPPGSENPGTVKSPPSVVEVPTADDGGLPGSLAFTGSNIVLVGSGRVPAPGGRSAPGAGGPHGAASPRSA